MKKRDCKNNIYKSYAMIYNIILLTSLNLNTYKTIESIVRLTINMVLVIPVQYETETDLEYEVMSL